MDHIRGLFKTYPLWDESNKWGPRWGSLPWCPLGLLVALSFWAGVTDRKSRVRQRTSVRKIHRGLVPPSLIVVHKRSQTEPTVRPVVHLTTLLSTRTFIFCEFIKVEALKWPRLFANIIIISILTSAKVHAWFTTIPLCEVSVRKSGP